MKNDWLHENKAHGPILIKTLFTNTLFHKLLIEKELLSLKNLKYKISISVPLLKVQILIPMHEKIQMKCNLTQKRIKNDSLHEWVRIVITRTTGVCCHYY